MKAVVWTKYGPPDVLQFSEVEKPIPKENEVLIKVHATTVTAGDCELRRLAFPIWLSLPIRIYAGLIRPIRIKVLGQELAGEIETVGKDVKGFKPSDQVFGTTGFGMGAYAEYICLPAKSGMGALAIKPDNLTYGEAATVPTGGLEALHFLRKANIQSGETILINGAGGSIGTFALQLAKHYGAEVIAVDSTEKLALLRSLGADKVIDYAKEDFTRSGEVYDVIFDVIGKSSFSRSIRSLKENGRYLIASPKLSKTFRGWWASMISSKQVIVGAANQSSEDLVFLKDLVETGAVQPVIDRTYLLEETAAAHRYAETGLKQGNIIIQVMPV